jgi:multicomponent Na+:H+ antiporter subunit G
MSAADIATAVLLPSGAAFSAVGTLGLLRFPDLLARLHAATKPQTTGLLLILIGAAFQASSLAAAASLLLVAMFQLLTAPILAQATGAAAYRAGAVATESLVMDEADGTYRSQGN